MSNSLSPVRSAMSLAFPDGTRYAALMLMIHSAWARVSRSVQKSGKIEQDRK
jgi:hypothetical protein